MTKPQYHRRSTTLRTGGPPLPAHSPRRGQRLSGFILSPLRRLGLLSLVVTLVATGGCGQQTATREKPTEDEIRQLQAKVDPPKPMQPFATPAPSSADPLHRQWGVKETAVDALGRIGEGAVPTLIQTLSYQDPHVRAEAARALARMGAAGKDAVPALISRLDDPDEDVRQAAARALGQMGSAAASAVPSLVGLIESPDPKSPPTPGQPRP
jgi:hypothetical protein